MKLLISHKPDGPQMPVLTGVHGTLRTPLDWEKAKEPSVLSPEQAAIAMICCARQGFEWEIVG